MLCAPTSLPFASEYSCCTSPEQLHACLAEATSAPQIVEGGQHNLLVSMKLADAVVVFVVCQHLPPNYQQTSK